MVPGMDAVAVPLQTEARRAAECARTKETRMLRSTSLVARTIACALSLSSVAVAAPSPARDDAQPRARALYADGQKALEAGNVEVAQRDFEGAYRTLPNAAVLLKIAECRIRRSDFRGAVGALEQYKRDRPDAPDREDVEAKVSELR